MMMMIMLMIMLLPGGASEGVQCDIHRPEFQFYGELMFDGFLDLWFCFWGLVQFMTILTLTWL